MKENKNEYTHFGVMLDCSRNAVMKVEEVKNFIDCIKKMGYDTLELYTEDTYEIDGEPYFGYLRGRYTKAELKELDAYARSKGVELIPCVQTLAHFTALVRHAAYQDIVDTDDILLIDEEKTYGLIDKIFATLAECFSSRLVNIGMDEAHMVGRGKYFDKHGDEDRFELLLRHLKRVVELAEKYGFKPHMWSDMFFRLATGGGYYVDKPMEFAKEITEKVPENVALTYWDYYSKTKTRYDNMLQSHKSFDREIWFAGGAWKWCGFAPHNAFSLHTMKEAMQSVRENGVKDVLITMWGDDGAECSAYAVLPSLYAIRQYALGNFDQAKIEKGFYELFKVKFDDFIKLDLPNMLDFNEKQESVINPCKALLYADPFMGFLDKTVSEKRAIPYAQYEAELRKTAKRAGKYAYVFQTLADLCGVMTVKAEIGVRTRRAYQSGDKKTLAVCLKDMQKLEKRLAAFHTSFYAQWHKENKTQGWEIQDARIGGLKTRVGTCAARLKAYLAGKLERLEELDEEILPYGDGRLSFQLYRRNISMSIL